ncbi:MAG: 3-deoxy-D-manno-octulosonic acid transferase, partial [Bacteroidota bacterium]
GHAVLNFREAYNSLLHCGAVRLISDEKMLAANVEYLLRSPDEREKMASSAKEALESMQGSLKRTKHILDSYLFPLTVKRGLEEFR